MNKISLPQELSNCQHCKAINKLRYYKEGNKSRDEYYCSDCYMISIWDGKIIEPIKAEAYINREYD